MATRVKICGITRLEDAQFAVELGAAALGFNFYPKSPRHIDPSAAAEIIRHLPPLVMTVGVFADEEDADQVLGVARDAGVAAIQLRGPRLPAMGSIRQNYPLIVTVPVHAKFQVAELSSIKANAYLLDSYDATLLGGTGKTFEWKLAREAARYGPIIVAGGLTFANVGQAIREARPFAVDVASGVESAPGVKDPDQVRAFFAAAAKADRELGDLAIV